MERITFKKLKARVTEINAERGVKNGTVGALQMYGDICGYAVDLIVNEAHGVSRLYGMNTPKECMKYLNSYRYIDDMARYIK